MKARQLIDGASYGPEALKAMGQAFDEAWQTIEGNFGNDPQDIEKARLRLARDWRAVASEDTGCRGAETRRLSSHGAQLWQTAVSEPKNSN
jgi:hypothetical protein